MPVRIHPISDVHLEFREWPLPDIDCDVFTLAGDITGGKNGFKAIKRLIANLDRPLVYVAGNHEAYGTSIERVRGKLTEIAQQNEFFHFLTADNPFTYENVTFVGDTLWTDFGLHGNPALSAIHASSSMNDYRRIRIGNTFRRLRVDDVINLHRQQLRGILNRIHQASPENDVVVMTHHAPCGLSVPEWYMEDPLSAAYATNIPQLVWGALLPSVKLWIHGHIHQKSDYMAGNVRVICNPVGYPGEVTGYDKGLIVTP